MTPYVAFSLFDRFLWWWGFWRWRPRAYAHNSQLKTAQAYARAYYQTLARLMRDAVYRREHHRDLLTGMVVAYRTGMIRRRLESRPGPWLKKWRRNIAGKLVGKPLVYEGKNTRVSDVAWAEDQRENVYAVATRQMRRHGGVLKAAA